MDNDPEQMASFFGEGESVRRHVPNDPDYLAGNEVLLSRALGAVTGEFIEKAHTLVNAHFAGEEQGTAIAGILFGKVNPNARLTAS